MNYRTEDFVGIYEDAFNGRFCQEVIEYFHAMQDAGYSKDRQKWQNTAKHEKEDDSITCTFEDEVRLNDTKTLNKVFLERFFDLINSYVDDFSILTNLPTQPQIYSNKIQKTAIGGGYHIWHCEDLGEKIVSGRLLAYILYLNDVEEGGETEFLYLHKRYKPKAGTLIVFPAAFTHAHRGNPPLSNEKYILTGWVEQAL